MSISRHVAAVSVAGAAICLAATACTSGSGQSPSSVAPTNVNPTARLSGVSLTMWLPATAQPIAAPVIKSFQAATGAKVSTVVIPTVYESNVPTKLQSGDKPDLMFWQPSKSTLPLLQPQNKLQVLGNQPWVAKLNPAFKSVGVVNGARYAAVVGVPNLIGVYYNKADFTKAGITSPPKNYQQMITDAKLIKRNDPGVAPFYEAGGDGWPLQMPVQAQMDPALPQSFWNAINTNKAKWTDPRIVSAITDYDTNVIKGGLAQPGYTTGTFAGQAQAVFTGQAAMATNLSIMVGQLETSHSPAQIDSKIGWVPVGPNGNVASYSTTAEDGMVAFKTGDARKEAAARQFLAYWLGPYYATFIKAQNLPSVLSDVKSPGTVPQLEKVQVAALPSAAPQFQVTAVYAPNMYLYLADMLHGKKTPLQVAQATEAEFSQAASAQGIPGF